MLTTIKLEGRLGQLFPDEYRFDISSPVEAVRALSSQVKGFRDEFIQGEYYITYRDQYGETDVDEEHLDFNFGTIDELVICPAIAGAKRGGAGKAIAGLVILSAAVFLAPPVVGALGPTQGLGTAAFSAFGTSVSFGQIALFGALTALGGIVQMLSPVPNVGDYNNRNQPDERPSYLFNGAVNTAEQGQPVPMVYGRMITGSVVISSGLSTEKL